MDLLFLFARILFGGYFLMSGINHFTKLGMLSDYAASKKVPSPRISVWGSGLLIIVGGVGVVLGIMIQLSVLFIALFLVPVSFKMHAFWHIQDPMAKMSDMINFTKNMALLGADILLLFIPMPWPLSLGI